MKASAFVATSMDGFIARPDGGLDWLPAGGEALDGEDYGYAAFMEAVDTVVIGRHAFEKVLTFGAWPYGDEAVVVLTRRTEGLPPLPAPTVRYMGGAPEEVVARLATRGAGYLYVDGGLTVQRFLDAGLIQRLTINRIPIILGSGIPLFGPVGRDIKLRHLWTRSYPNGFVQSEYEVVA